MRVKVRNWILGGVAIAAFVLGLPLVQYVFATTGANNIVGNEKAQAAVMPAHAGEGHVSAVKVGDQYVQIIPTGEGSVGILLYDSEFRLVAANENEGSVQFSLPNGEKRTIAITVPARSRGCTMDMNSPGEMDCCAADGGMASHHEECEHEGQ